MLRPFLALTMAAGLGTAACEHTPSGPERNAPSMSLVATCDTELADLESTLDASQGAFTNNRDYVQLSLKIDEAREKITAGNTTDALRKLSDIRGKVVALSTAAKPKLTAEAAASLIAQADAAIACLQG